VSRVIASARAPGVAWATFDAHRDGDFRPYVFRTDDFGATWTPKTAGLPDMGSVNVVVEHPDDPDVLFLGTEHHAFASTDAGATWARIPNLPTTAYDDILVHPREQDVVFGTHGRSIWILDDTRPFVEWSAVSGPAFLFSVRPTALFQYKKDTSYRGNADFVGDNPDEGALVTYRLGPGSEDAVLRITREDGTVVRRMQVPGAEGVHRVSWDLRHAVPGRPDVWERFEDPQLAHPLGQRGPLVSPGHYTLTLEARGTEWSRPLEVLPDPEMPISLAEYRARERFLVELLELSGQVAETMRAMGVSGGGFGFGRPSGPPDSPEARIRAVARTINGVYSSLNGAQVREGSLYPPTQSMRDAVADAKRELEALQSQMGGSSG
jgi:hypothetical protein